LKLPAEVARSSVQSRLPSFPSCCALPQGLVAAPVDLGPYHVILFPSLRLGINFFAVTPSADRYSVSCRNMVSLRPLADTVLSCWDFTGRAQIPMTVPTHMSLDLLNSLLERLFHTIGQAWSRVEGMMCLLCAVGPLRWPSPNLPGYLLWLPLLSLGWVLFSLFFWRQVLSVMGRSSNLLGLFE